MVPVAGTIFLTYKYFIKTWTSKLCQQFFYTSTKKSSRVFFIFFFLQKLFSEGVLAGIGGWFSKTFKIVFCVSTGPKYKVGTHLVKIDSVIWSLGLKVCKILYVLKVFYIQINVKGKFIGNGLYTKLLA